MPATELVTHIQNIFETQEDVYGQTNHRDVALALVGKASSLKPAIGREILRMSTREHLYEGAEATLRHLLTSNDQQDRVVIWTQGNPTGQLWKLAMSGLIELRHVYGKDRFGIHAAEDKIATLPGLLDELAEQGSQRVVIVDDKAKNVVKVAQIAQTWKAAHPEANVDIVPIWINQGRTKNQVPKDHTLESFTSQYQTITDIRDLQTLPTPGQTTAWLIDWDHTLNETAVAKQQLFHTIASRIESAHPDPILGSHVLDLQARVVGASSITELPNGMSGRRVLDVQHQKGAVVIKHAPGSPKMAAEIRGIQHLQQMPHAALMPCLNFASEYQGVISMERVNGTSGRDKLQQDTITPEDLYHVDNVVDMKLRWIDDIRSGRKRTPEHMQPRSMQREELDDTRTGVLSAVNALSTTSGITADAIISHPLFFDGRLHLSMLEALNALEKFYSSTEHDPRFPLHGDISWGNMIFGTDTIHIIDGEWAGLHDPAEAYTRTAKVISTTTAPKNSIHGTLMLGFNRGRQVIQLSTNNPFSQCVLALQKYMFTRGKEFEHVTQDNRFMQKLYMYLAGSYARELAIAERRGMGSDEQIFALRKFVEMVELSQTV